MTAPARAISPRAAVLLMAAAVAATIPVAGLVHALGLGWMASFAVVELACFALPAVVAGAGAGSVRGALALGRPRSAALLGGMLIGATFWYLNLILVAPWLSRFATEGDEQLGAYLTAADPLWAQLLVLAVLPGLCEELLVRGAILRGLVGRLGAAGAVAASTVYFSLLHLSPARALPTALLGALLAVVVLRSGSVWPAVIAHALNNAAAVLLSSPALAGAAAALSAHPLLAAAAAAVLTGAGLALACHRPGGSASSGEHQDSGS
ncbi:MAG TPA: type II CAAX endopeptidase family protein [Kofleriaceae bacterium]|nr:type II CAAX endopeptidase family protein [Kofleriaceae bacterium]